MKPFAPEIVGPISVCSQAVEVRGNIAGATIEILVNGSAVSSHPAPTANSAYSVGASLNAGDEVAARQKFDGETSSASLPIVVQAAPQQPSALTIHTQPHHLGRAVLVTGAVPGAKVDVRIGNQTVGFAEAISGWAKAIYDPPLSVGQKLTLKQNTCNNATTSQSSLAALALPNPLPAPLIYLPLIECQNSITIGGVVDGAYVEMYRNDVLENTFVFSISKEWFWIAPLSKNDIIKVRQGFKSKKDSPALEIVSPFASTTVHPIKALAAPEFLGIPCPGTTYLTLGKLIPGARLILSVNGVEIGQTDAPADTYTFPVPPLEAGAKVEAYMMMCGNKGPAASVRVTKKSQSPKGLKISTPYACSAYVYIKVDGAQGNYQVYITNKNGEHLSSYHNLIGFDAFIPVSPSLLQGDEITINAQGCGGSWDKYGPYSVVSGAPAATMVEPVQATNTYCEVSSPAAGARVDVYINNTWSASAISVGDLATTVVRLINPLKVGDKVYCTQTLCGKTSKPSKTATVTKHKPRRPVLLQPAEDSQGVNLQPTFVWEDPGAGSEQSADSFQLVVTKDDTPVIDVSVTGTTYQSPNTLSTSTDYDWSVTAINGGGQAKAMHPYPFKTKAPEKPPEATLRFVPPITSGAQGSFPRGEQFSISIEVENAGNATSSEYAVLFAQRTSDGTQLLGNILTVPMAALAAGSTTLATALIVINIPDSVRIDTYLLVNDVEIDSAFRIV